MMRRLLFFITLFCTLLALDMGSKYYVLHDLSSKIFSEHTGRGLPVFNFFGIDFSIGLTFNRGAAWGMFANFKNILLVVRIAIVIALFFYLIRNRAQAFPLILILTGAVGNILDFFIYGYVIDFLHFRFWGHSFPLFNVADSLISVGVMFLFFNLYFKKKDARV